jgi:cell division septation protein DedD
MNLKETLIIAFATLMMVSCSSLRKGSSSFSDSQSPYVKEESPKPKAKSSTTTSSTASSTTKTTSAKPATTAKPIVVREEKVKTLDRDANSRDYNYYVIIGSFRILDNAKNFKSQLIEEGFKPLTLENETGLYRISVASSDDETAARDRIAAIRSQYSQYSDVWLLVSKK